LGDPVGDIETEAALTLALDAESTRLAAISPDACVLSHAGVSVKLVRVAACAV
jgi:hypothetical protein